MSGASAIRSLVLLRAVIGLIGWIAPGLAGRLFGLDPDGNPQLPYIARLFAVRDLALAVGSSSTDGDAQRRWLQAGLACDAADTAAALLAYRDGSVGPMTAVMLTAPAASAVAMGVIALSDGGGAPARTS